MHDLGGFLGNGKKTAKAFLRKTKVSFLKMSPKNRLREEGFPFEEKVQSALSKKYFMGNSEGRPSL